MSEDKKIQIINNGLIESVCNSGGNSCVSGGVLDALLQINKKINTKDGGNNKKKKPDKQDKHDKPDKHDKHDKPDVNNMTDKEKIKLIEDVKEKLGCNTGVNDMNCILEHSLFKKYTDNVDVMEFINKLKPNGPATKNGLLSNVDIDGFLSRLSKEPEHADYYHIPFQMRDFKEVSSELARINIAKDVFGKGFNKFGVVFNTDYSSGPGIHWYCVYGEKDNNNISIEYFNSSGEKPLDETMVWLCTLCHTLRKDIPGSNVKIKYSTGIKFQSDNHSCGVYSIMYIYYRVKGISSNYMFEPNNFNDEYMHEARKLLFLNKK
jgi:hypothetical protein